MKTWNIRVVDVLGKPISQSRAAIRYAFSYVWFVPPLGAAAIFKLTGLETGVITVGWVLASAIMSRFNPQQQFWHDVAAGTRLVSSEPMSR